MRTPARGAPPTRPPAGRAGRTAAPILTAAVAALLAFSGALPASATHGNVSLSISGDDEVQAGGTHAIDVTAVITGRWGGPVGCVKITAPTGWTDLTIVDASRPRFDWSADDGPPATWRADSGSDKLRDEGDRAEIELSAVAPGTAGTGKWRVTLHDSQNCTDMPFKWADFEVEVIAPAAVPDLDIVPASATVETGEDHQVAFTAEWIVSDGDEIGCIEVTLPAGWTGIGTSGTGSPAGWSSAVIGQDITWTADTGMDVIDATGESATFTVAATAPGTAGDSDWTAAVYAAIDCSGEPLLTGTAAVTLEEPPVEPEADLEMTPASATITVGTTHDVDAVATWLAGEGNSIGCVIVTLPAGWTLLGLSDGLPAGWSGTVDETTRTVTWQADTKEDALSSPGDAASFTVTATGPGTPGTSVWEGAAYENIDCEAEPFLTDSALITLVAAPPDDGGGDGGDGGDVPEVLATDPELPEVLATDPPVPGSIPAGEGPAPLTQRSSTASVLAGLAAAAAALAALIRRRAARREREEVTAR